MIHLVVNSRFFLEVKGSEDPVWYIGTNLEDPAGALNIYSRRMWIDEMFRDMKSELRLGRNRITSEEIFSRLLGIVILAYIFIMMEEIANASDQLILRIAKKRKGNLELSIFTRALKSSEFMTQEAIPEDIKPLIVAFAWPARK